MEGFDGRTFLAVLLILSQTSYGAQKGAFGQVAGAAAASSPSSPSTASPTPATLDLKAWWSCPSRSKLGTFECPPRSKRHAAPGKREREKEKEKENKEKQNVKKVELTDFQRLVESSLGQVLPIYGASLFEECAQHLRFGSTTSRLRPITSLAPVMSS